LNAVTNYVGKLPAANGKVAVAGFCWGGAQSFRFATNRPNLAAAFVFYGTSPENNEEMAKIKAPVYGFYGGNDERVNATIPTAQEVMKANKKTYQPVTYDGAGHGFMRAGEEAAGLEENKKARNQAWERWLSLLKKI
jgi:carboxymethylenebutenolidase